MCVRGWLAVVALVVATAGCSSNMRTATAYTGKYPRSDAVLVQAARDLSCPLDRVRVVAETSRRGAIEIALRFIVDGCGARASYVEECDLMADPREPGWTIIEDSLACRDFLIAKVPLAEGRQP